MQNRADFHPSWKAVWDSVNEALGDIKDMRFLAHQANLRPAEKSPLQRPKFAVKGDAGAQLRRPAGRTPAEQRAAIMEFAEGILDVLREAGGDPTDRPQIPLVESEG